MVKYLISLALLQGCITALQQPGDINYHQDPTQLDSLYDSNEAHPNRFDLNDRPIIGIVTQPLEEHHQNVEELKQYRSYIMQGYVDFAKVAGAQIIPLDVNEPQEVTDEKLSKINGVIFPGGNGDYIEYGRHIYNKAIEFNDEGKFFPLFGICLGFQNMAIWASDLGTDVLDVIEEWDVSKNIKFLMHPSKTKQFAYLGDKARIFEERPMLWNNHLYSIKTSTYWKDKSFQEMFKMTSQSTYVDPSSGNEINYAASIEAKNYPFYGMIWHPEKPNTKYNDNSNADHGWVSIMLQRYFSDFFTAQTRQNTNNFGNFAERQAALIENYDLNVNTLAEGIMYVFQ